MDLSTESNEIQLLCLHKRREPSSSETDTASAETESESAPLLSTDSESSLSTNQCKVESNARVFSFESDPESETEEVTIPDDQWEDTKRYPYGHGAYADQPPSDFELEEWEEREVIEPVAVKCSFFKSSCCSVPVPKTRTTKTVTRRYRRPRKPPATPQRELLELVKLVKSKEEPTDPEEQQWMTVSNMLQMSFPFVGPLAASFVYTVILKDDALPLYLMGWVVACIAWFFFRSKKFRAETWKWKDPVVIGLIVLAFAWCNGAIDNAVGENVEDFVEEVAPGLCAADEEAACSDTLADTEGSRRSMMEAEQPEAPGMGQSPVLGGYNAETNKLKAYIVEHARWQDALSGGF